VKILKRILRSSIKTKITGSIVSVISLIAIFITLYFPTRQQTQAFHTLEDKAKSLAEMLAYNVSSELQFDNIQEVEKAISGGKQNKDLSYVVIYDSQNRMVASYDFEDNKWVFKKKGARRIEPFVDPEMVNIFKPIFSPEGKIGYLAIGMSLSDLRKEVAHNQRVTFLVSLFIIISGIVLANHLSDTLSKPILRLTDAVQRVSKGETEVEVEAETQDEIGILAKAFNRMIVELKRSREQLIHHEKLASMGQLAAGVAHELNNPLGGILGYSQFALEKMARKSVDNFTQEDIRVHSQYLKDIEGQSQRCKSIVQQLLKFARASTKEPFEPIDLGAVLKETLSFIRAQLEIENIKLIQNLSPFLTEILGNANQLQQVFTNIILNALQAMPEGGELAVSSQTIEEKDRRLVQITFSDTGCGIPKENLDRIFEPFFTTKEIGQGTGLGLSVSYGIIKDHEGSILVESEPGKGTTFIVNFPVPDRFLDSQSKVQECEYTDQKV
jgi:two-component system NtrC family sensor kinase